MLLCSHLSCGQKSPWQALWWQDKSVIGFSSCGRKVRAKKKKKEKQTLLQAQEECRGVQDPFEASRSSGLLFGLLEGGA